MRKLISIGFILISLISVYIHYQNNISSEIQKLLYDDLYSGNYIKSREMMNDVIKYSKEKHRTMLSRIIRE